MSDTGIDNQVFITDDDGNFISTKDMSVWTRVKMWEKRNDTAIKAFGLGVMFGLGVGLGIGLRQVQVVANIKSPGAVATGVQQLARRGHPGNAIECVETGEVFASQRRAADATPDQTNDMMIRAYRDTKSAFACYDIADSALAALDGRESL